MPKKAMKKAGQIGRKVGDVNWLKWASVLVYVVSPIDLDPGMPFTDAALLAWAIYDERKRIRKGKGTR